MSHTAVPRRRTPVLFVAYGDDGTGWLRALRARCEESSQVRALIEREIVQFWCIGASDAGSTGVRVWDDTLPPADVAAALDRARSAYARAEIPDLEVREVRVLERVSLFAARAAERRVALRTALLAVPDSDAQASHGQQGFRYRWVALADALHEPMRVSAGDRDAARRAIEAVSEDVTTFLVDRQDSDVAVVDEELAAHCLGELAMSFVHGDIGAPRTDGEAVTLPQMLVDPRPGHVTPFGVAVLEHPWREIETARVRAFRAELATGVVHGSSVDAAFGRTAAVLDAVRDDRVALDRGQYDRHTGRRVREEALEQALARVLAEGDVRWMRGTLDDVRREMALLRRGTLPYGQPTVAAAPVVVPPALLQVAAGDGLPPGVLAALSVALVAAVSALVVLRRRRAAEAAADVLPALSDQTDRGLRDDVHREWDQLCRQLSELLDAWGEECRAARARDEAPPAPPTWTPKPPIAWRLSHELDVAGDEIVVTPELCRDVARDCVSLLDGRAPAPQALEQACRRQLRRWDARRHGTRPAASVHLQNALAAARATQLKRFIETRPYLANPATPPIRDAVVWLSVPALAIGDQLRDLEQVATRAATSMLSHDDDERSVRLSFAQPVPWRAIPSLAPASADPRSH